ncbi:hypothetical protein H4Q26_017167 [Puccinia striiformis f. sp. tritici PST-130]|nr:hypothetical protein H4Q26_017167 [Puccinia striiformis f. sp. tritici PST-130]
MRSPCPTLLEAFLLVALLIAVNTDARRAKGEPKVKGYYPTYNSEAQPPSRLTGLRTPTFSTSCPQARREPSSQYGWLDRLTTLFEFDRHCSLSQEVCASPREFCQKAWLYRTRNGLGIDGIGCNSRNPDDVVNFGLLTKELRTLWPEVELTAAVGITGLNGADGSPATPKETALLTANLDYINLMAYDVFGSWSETTGPIAPLYATCAPAGAAQSVETGLQVALKQGFKASQVLLGIPGYAKRSELASPKLVPKVVGSHTTLYYQKPTGVTPPGGKFDDKPGKDICGNAQKWGGSFLVTELISNGWLSKDQKTGLKGYKRYFDECSGQPFLSNGKYLISYDDKDSTIAKAKFAKKNNMGGIYFFDTMGPPADTLQEARKIFS